MLPRPALIGLSVVSFPTVALALATEALGNAPIGRIWAGMDGHLLAAVNQPERVYWYEVNGNPTFYFRGGADALDQAVRRFVAIPAERREIVLLPGPGETRLLNGKTPVTYDWSVHVPMGFHFTDDPDIGDVRATLVIHVPTPRATAVADSPAFRSAIADLDSHDFRIRERASKTLRDMGSGAAPLLRVARANAGSPESASRLDGLLAPYRGVQIDLLTIPADISVVGPDDLLARARKGLASQNPSVRAYTLGGFTWAGLSPAELVPELLEFVEREQHEYPLRCAASVLSRLKMKAAATPLRAKAAGQTKSVRDALEQAAATLDAAKEEPGERAELATIRRDIRAFIQARSKPSSR